MIPEGAADRVESPVEIDEADRLVFRLRYGEAGLEADFVAVEAGGIIRNRFDRDVEDGQPLGEDFEETFGLTDDIPVEELMDSQGRFASILAFHTHTLAAAWTRD